MSASFEESTINNESENVPIENANQPNLNDEANRRSPDSNCPICLGPIEDKAFANKCFHNFCKVCLFEWSKVKAECPVCRQRFDSIIYNIRANDDYDEEKIETNLRRDQFHRSGVFWSNIDGMRIFFPHPIHYRTSLTPLRRRIYEFYRNERNAEPVIYQPSLRTVTLLFSSSSRSRRNSNHNEQLEQDSSPSPSRPLRPCGLPILSERNIAPPNKSTSAYRRYIYETDLWVLPFGNGDSSRVRETSARFYNLNPACTHRLLPWLNREIVGLLGTYFHNQMILRSIMRTILEHDIVSLPFYNLVKPYFHKYTSHFIHEFYNFARSGYDIEKYSQLARYVTKNLTEVVDTTMFEDAYKSNRENNQRCSHVSSTSSLSRHNVNHVNREKVGEKQSVEDTDDSIIIVDDSDSDSSPKSVKSETSEAVKSITKNCQDTLAKNSPTLRVEVIDDFDNPQPGPSGLSSSRELVPNYVNSDDDDDTDDEPSTAWNKMNKNWTDDEDAPQSEIDVGRNEFEENERHSNDNNNNNNRENSETGEHNEDSDVEIIGYKKPIKMRTPEIININSEESESENNDHVNNKKVDHSPNGFTVKENESNDSTDSKRSRKEKKCKRKKKESKHRSKSKCSKHKRHKSRNEQKPFHEYHYDSSTDSDSDSDSTTSHNRGKQLASVVFAVNKSTI